MTNLVSCPHCGGSLRAVWLSLNCPICNDPYQVIASAHKNGRGNTCSKRSCRLAYRKRVYAAKVADVIDTGKLCKCGCGKKVTAPRFKANVTVFATPKCRNWWFSTYMRKAKQWTNRGAK